MAEQKIVCKAIIEMLGHPKEHIEETMKKYVDKIEEDYKKIKLTDTYISEAEHDENQKLYSVFSELDMEITDIGELSWFCLDYLPSSIEIMEPEELKYDTRDFTHFLNDLLAKLHKIGNELKTYNAQNKTLRKNSVTITKNMMLYQLKDGPKTAAQLGKNAGMPEEDAKKFLESMVKENKIKETNGKYSLPKR